MSDLLRHIQNIILKTKNTVERPKYTFDEAYNATLKYFDGDELAAKVWTTKYDLKTRMAISMN